MGVIAAVLSIVLGFLDYIQLVLADNLHKNVVKAEGRDAPPLRLHDELWHTM